MARRPNYGAEKRQKEIQRQKKREAKAEKKRLKREEGVVEVDGAMEEGSAEPDAMSVDSEAGLGDSSHGATR
jgi:hypothetical protein